MPLCVLCTTEYFYTCFIEIYAEVNGRDLAEARIESGLSTSDVYVLYYVHLFLIIKWGDRKSVV